MLLLRRTILLVDLRLHVEVDARDDDVGHNVQCAHAVEHIGVIKWDLFRDLHKSPAWALEIGPVYMCATAEEDAYRMMTRLVT